MTIWAGFLSKKEPTSRDAVGDPRAAAALRARIAIYRAELERAERELEAVVMRCRMRKRDRNCAVVSRHDRLLMDDRAALDALSGDVAALREALNGGLEDAALAVELPEPQRKPMVTRGQMSRRGCKWAKGRRMAQ